MSLCRALERVGQAAVLLDSDLSVRHANRTALRLLGPHFNLRSDRSGGRLKSRGERRAAPLTVQMHPVSLPDGDPGMLALLRAKGVRATVPDSLARSLDLTPAQARIAVLAAGALSVSEIARHAGLSRNTVKTHLKAIYAALGVRSRAALIRALAARPPDRAR